MTMLPRYREGLPRRGRVMLVALAWGLLAACQPTVKIEAPEKPITINLNIKLDAQIRVKLEAAAAQDIKANPEIF